MQYEWLSTIELVLFFSNQQQSMSRKLERTGENFQTPDGKLRCIPSDCPEVHGLVRQSSITYPYM